MKRYLTLTIAILMFMAVVTITADAQGLGSKHISARIPFAFNVGNRTLPAGDYTIRVVNPSSDRRVLRIQSKDGQLSALIQTTGAKSTLSDDAKLVFHRYGDTYFFAQAQMAADSTMLAAVKTSAERSKERELASNVRKASVEILAE